ncbi:MAG TPA: DUF421 domain-containing protein [Clostridiales bacterium]|nr:DUF421 domain-containing protein [Clostridiales bacterium]
MFVILGLRLMGKRQIGHMQPNELVITILISEIATMAIQNLTQPVLLSVLTIFILVSLEIIISFIAMKSNIMRKILNGHSAVVIKDGVIDQKLLKQLRLTVSDLMEILRQKDVFNIEQVQYAILETNGSISVLLKPENRTATVQDVGASNQDTGIPALVISDGVVINEGLKLAETDTKKLKHILDTHRLEYQDVFLMTLDRTGNHIIIRKE